MKINRYFSWSAVLLVLIVASCTENFTEVRKNEVPTGPEFVPGEVLIKFKKPTGSGSRVSQDILSLIRATPVETIETVAMKSAQARSGEETGPLMLVKSELGTNEAISVLFGNPNVEYAEPNWIYRHWATSNDPLYTNSSLWGMYGSKTTPANQFGTGAGAAWASGGTGTSTVYVGVIDEGYMYTHEDLSANAGVNPGEKGGNGEDDDRNGYVDDVYGWDFDGNNNTVFDGPGDDHGTHVAGTIGAVGGNGMGVAGVVWNVKILSGKFLGSSGGTTANAIKAVDYFTDLKKKGLNLVATNNSWGGGGYSQGLYDAIERSKAAGILFVVAAGNNKANIDRRASYPASYNNTNIISVAAITSTGGLASFSNYGSVSVDIGAPGEGIVSTLPSGYGSYSGTSMATPHVTGAVALYKSKNPTANMDATRQAIINAGTPTNSLSGKVASGDRLNVSGF